MSLIVRTFMRRVIRLAGCLRLEPAVGTVALVVALGFVAGAGADETLPVPDDQCVACHVADENLPADYMDYDTHLRTGLSCAGCHGGDPTRDDPDAAMSPDAGFVGVPSREEIPKFCGKCHSKIEFMRKYQPRIPTDQESQYATSIHGKRLAKGDKKVAECVSCHTAHRILPASDTRSSVHPFNVPKLCNGCHGNADYMAPYAIRTDQYEQYAQSVHGVALLQNQDTGAPACNDCHGNHGAIPPGITSIRQVCGNCHVNNMKYFSESRMGKAFAVEQLHGCEECHGNHDVRATSDDMVGVGEKSVCMDCHDVGDDGYKAAEKIHGHLVELVGLYDSARRKQETVQRIGMDDVDIGYLLQESHQSLIEARTLVHTFDPDEVGAKTEVGAKKAQEAIGIAEEEIKDHRVRRWGFGMATLFITVLVVALFLKVRQMEGA